MRETDSGFERVRSARMLDTGASRNGAALRRNGGRFVIEKHDARRSHFDLRLEVDGVLKSWAVAHGPSLDPADKRLAVRTEDQMADCVFLDAGHDALVDDHSRAGIVVWDIGIWLPHGDAEQGIEAGLLKFDLDGSRFKGGFALVRLGTKPRDVRENWLLMKARDEHAARDVTDPEWWANSLAASNDMDQRTRPRRGRRAKRRPLLARLDGGRDSEDPHPGGGAAAPSFVAPQLATAAEAVPAGPGWLHEIKYDGYRVIAALGASQVILYTRTGLDWTHRFRSLAGSLARLAPERRPLLIDGEIVVLDATGRSDFGRLQHALTESSGEPLALIAFDLLQAGGIDLRPLPLLERKRELAALLADAPPDIRYGDHVADDGDRLLAHAAEIGLEGVVSKAATAPYRSGRTTTWLKIKCRAREELVIGGYRASDVKGRPFSSLLVGAFDGDALVYRGRVGTGFDDRKLDRLTREMAPIARASPPFATVPREVGRDARWVEPKLVAEIEYRGWTRDGILRHASFVGLREDKAAREVRNGEPAVRNREPSVAGSNTRLSGAAGRAKAAGPAQLGKVTLTHPDKVLFESAGLTKLDLATYLAAAAPLMLPHLRGRPISLVRCPDGASAKCFFQKHAKDGMPAEIGAIAVPESDGGSAEYIAISDPAGLVATAQIGALEVHIWGSRLWGSGAGALEKPDRLVFDLDPDEGLPFDEVRRAATDVRDLLGEAGLQSFPLVTGGKGIHVVAPLLRRRAWAEVKQFAHGFATRLAESDPTRFTAALAKAKRRGRIFIDYLRNERGSTAIAPYSLRAKPAATVAMPVSWRELDRLDRASAFTLPEAQARLAGRRAAADPWEGYFELRQAISPGAFRFFTTAG